MTRCHHNHFRKNHSWRFLRLSVFQHCGFVIRKTLNISMSRMCSKTRSQNEARTVTPILPRRAAWLIVRAPSPPTIRDSPTPSKHLQMGDDTSNEQYSELLKYLTPPCTTSVARRPDHIRQHSPCEPTRERKRTVRAGTTSIQTLSSKLWSQRKPVL